MAFPKKLSAYMAYSNANRERVKAELVSGGNEKPSIADIARAISASWNAMTDEERAALKEEADKAYETAVAEAVARGEAPEEKADAGSSGDGKAAEGDTTLPVARVKRIIKLDKDVKQASADAIKCITKAVELFLEGLAEGAHASMRAAKRKGVQYGDLENFIMRRSKYEFLHDHVWSMRPREDKGEGDDDDDDDDDAPSAKKAKKIADANGSMRVTDFFKPGASPAKKQSQSEIVIDDAIEPADVGVVVPETEIQTDDME